MKEAISNLNTRCCREKASIMLLFAMNFSICVNRCHTHTHTHTYIYIYTHILLLLLFIYFEGERVCVCMQKQGRGREREGEREDPQAGSMLSAQSPMWGWIPGTMRSWPERKSRAQCLRDWATPGALGHFFQDCLVCVYLWVRMSLHVCNFLPGVFFLSTSNVMSIFRPCPSVLCNMIFKGYIVLHCVVIAE